MKPLLAALLASLALALPAEAGPESLTLEAERRTITYGDALTLSGVVSPAAKVTVLALPYHGGAIPSHAVPDDEGRWALSLRPLITTQFRALAGRVDSAETPVVSVRPRVHLVVLSARRGLFYTRAEALFGLPGRTASFQRLTGDGWATVKRVRLGPRAAVRFRGPLPRGSSRVRVSIEPVAGYARGLSRTALVVSRRE